MNARTAYRPDGGLFALVLALLFACALVLTSCASRQRAVPRPKFGDTTTPVGPDKSHFRSQPKFQP